MHTIYVGKRIRVVKDNYAVTTDAFSEVGVEVGDIGFCVDYYEDEDECGVIVVVNGETIFANHDEVEVYPTQ